MAPSKDDSFFGGYFEATRRPIYSIVISAPFFIAYELGVLFLMPSLPLEQHRRNLAEMILHRPASLVGKHAAYLLPVVLGMVMLFVMHRQQQREAAARAGKKKVPPPGPFRLDHLTGMYLEALILALPLPLIYSKIPNFLAAGGTEGSLLFRLTTMCGAGAYEELLFRLFLFTGFFWLSHKLLHLERLPAGLLAAVVSGVLFSLFHFVYGQEFYLLFFIFATIAGIYFAMLCHFRSFGTAVATHALYDIFLVLTGH